MKDNYSTIRLGKGKAHIFNHLANKVLCGVDRWKYPPFTINKNKSNAEEIQSKHSAFAERRGGPNPYKFTCKRCEQLIKEHVIYENKTMVS